MEANFLRDYQCCGVKLDSLHELLQHFEENHAQQSSQITHRTSSSSSQGGRRPSLGQLANSNGFQGFQQQRQQPPTSGGQSGFSRTQLTTVQDMDSLEDMEMDDEPATPSTAIVQPQPQQPQQQFNSPNMNLASLNTPLANTMNAKQAFRQSAPTTPATTQPFSLFNNPTVSSVNTPTLSTQSMQPPQNRTSPDSSVPGTPGEIESNFTQNYMGGLPMHNNGQMIPDDFNLGSGIGFGLSNFNDLTIDEPAKRLFSKQGGLNPQQLQYAVKTGQIPMDSEFAKLMREQQLISGAGGPVISFPEPEVKPFKCPVIGCEKAYKNQNGLKYHKQVIAIIHLLPPLDHRHDGHDNCCSEMLIRSPFQHGHQNQKLQENEDGSFSIVDPVTSIPYPGTVGMEKEKPYRCDVCGKRYKNLNGLKYHRAHSPPCNPELKLNQFGPAPGMAGLQGLGGMDANIAGAGLGGMGGDGSGIF